MARSETGRIGRILGIAAGVVTAGAALLWLREQETESPDFETIEEDGAYEIRRYAPMLAVETEQLGPRDRALGNGFGLLADYIFAETRGGEEIAMTTPIFATAEEGGWRVWLAAPMGLTRETLPKPGRGVSIVEVPERTLAVVRFSGRVDDRALAYREDKLKAWLKRRGHAAIGPAEHAYYNSPIVPGPLKHSEVHLPLN
jgi:effector-binding domain-containing protein